MLVTVEYSKDHGTFKKGDERQMPISTAQALEGHGVLKITSKPKADEAEAEDTGKPETITTKSVKPGKK